MGRNDGYAGARNTNYLVYDAPRPKGGKRNQIWDELPADIDPEIALAEHKVKEPILNKIVTQM